MNLTKSFDGMPAITVDKAADPVGAEYLYFCTFNYSNPIRNAVCPHIRENSDSRIVVELWAGSAHDHEAFRSLVSCGWEQLEPLKHTNWSDPLSWWESVREVLGMNGVFLTLSDDLKEKIDTDSLEHNDLLALLNEANQALESSGVWLHWRLGLMTGDSPDKKRPSEHVADDRREEGHNVVSDNIPGMLCDIQK